MLHRSACFLRPLILVYIPLSTGKPDRLLTKSTGAHSGRQCTIQHRAYALASVVHKCIWLQAGAWVQVDQHPGGGARIMLAAGGAIDPFWAMYAQHQNPEVQRILETYRIGDLVRRSLLLHPHSLACCRDICMALPNNIHLVRYLCPLSAAAAWMGINNSVKLLSKESFQLAAMQSQEDSFSHVTDISQHSSWCQSALLSHEKSMTDLQEGGADPSKQVADPYANEPKRHRALIVRSPKPFNAETPKDALGSSPTTPNELFYVRNHLPVPHVEPGAYSVRALQHF